ncbi:histidine kinase [Streptomyces sp. NPDC046915]|uniref:sensor histidine kinase n=1 Tax=Streptomyces sp. NPDC046915 TaxID=3155257 RepID=UPI0033CA8D5A
MRSRLGADVGVAAASAAVAVALALTVHDGSRPMDAVGLTLLLAAQVPLVLRRRRPVAVLVAVVLCVAPYHAVDYDHSAAVPAGMIALYTVAVTGSTRRTVLTGVTVVGGTVTLNAVVSPHQIVEILRISGWIVSVLLLGGYLRVHRQNVAAALERAERAERTREEEARRRVAEERLRIARDLHDLLAHSITLIGVQTSVAAHVLAADPDRLDRAAVAKALDDIAGTCRTARGELRTTLEVLRDHGHGSPDTRGPLPGLHGLPDLARTAHAAGAEVELSVRADGVPGAVGAAAYRIVQEALTNAVRYGGRDDLTVRVRVYEEGRALRVRVTDDGTGAGAGEPGFGLVGMRERARSVGGTLDAGPLPERGFEVTAVLPFATAGEGTR